MPRPRDRGAALPRVACIACAPVDDTIDVLQIRSLHEGDAGLLRAAFEALSGPSRYQRFLAFAPLTETMARYLCRVDGSQHVARAAFTRGAPRLVGVARFIRDPVDRATAEVAVTIADPWQRRGLGTKLLLELAEVARSVGVTTLAAHTLADNQGIRRLMAKAGAVSAITSGPESILRVDLHAPAA